MSDPTGLKNYDPDRYEDQDYHIWANNEDLREKAAGEDPKTQDEAGVAAYVKKYED